MSTRKTYHDAVAALNSLQSSSKDIEARKVAGSNKIPIQDRSDNTAIQKMREWVRRIGYQPSDFKRLNAVHIAGTKGKGSTCAFVSSILSYYQRTRGIPRKIALYTSPHLIAVRERLQINAESISEDQFTKYFFEVWDRLESSALLEGHDPSHKPTYFRFLTLMSFHVFIEEGVDTAIYEVGVGGERDSTNIIDYPTATGITSLGIDHVAALGGTIEQISWHKAGIFKFNSPAFTVDQYPAAKAVLEKRAKEKRVELICVGIHPDLGNVKLKHAVDFQKKNASLAIHLAGAALAALGISFPDLKEKLPDGFREGLENAVCRGRFELNVEGPTEWYLDGAHTLDSLIASGEWFGKMISKEPEILGRETVSNALIFNQQSRPEVLLLLKALYQSIENTLNGPTSFDHVVFCTNVTWKGKGYNNDLINRNANPAVIKNMTVQKELAAMWKTLDTNAKIHVLGSVEEAVDFARALGKESGKAKVFVTGSLHLVGGVLAVQQGKPFN